MLVFVYGTLKRGHANHHWLNGAPFHGEAICGGLMLYDLGPFPMALVGRGEAHGEVFAVGAAGLARLDRLEGYPRLYDRVRLPLRDGRVAWVYVGRAQLVRHVSLVAEGRWSGPVGRPPRSIRRG